jgi:hypothetical protein
MLNLEVLSVPQAFPGSIQLLGTAVRPTGEHGSECGAGKRMLLSGGMLFELVCSGSLS